MKRREFVRTLLSIISAPKLLFSQQSVKPPARAAAPVPWFIGLNPRTPIPETSVADQVAASELRFFSVAQMKTLRRLSSLFMPPFDGKPGALDAGTPEFLDFLLETSAAEKQKLYTGGLDWLDGAAQHKYKKPFAELNDGEADAMVRPWLRTWMTDHPPTEAHADFLNIALDEIRTATINSQPWSRTPATPAGENGETALYWQPIEPDMGFVYAAAASCNQVPPHVRAVPKRANAMPVYKR